MLISTHLTCLKGHVSQFLKTGTRPVEQDRHIGYDKVSVIVLDMKDMKDEIISFPMIYNTCVIKNFLNGVN